MAGFQLPQNLIYNRGAIQEPTAYARETGCASWLFLVGEEFASMPGGMSYAQVQQAVPVSARVVSDPPLELDLDLARQHVAALEQLPRPTLISCRTRAESFRRCLHVRRTQSGGNASGGGHRGRARRRSVLRVSGVQGMGAVIDGIAARRGHP